MSSFGSSAGESVEATARLAQERKTIMDEEAKKRQGGFKLFMADKTRGAAAAHRQHSKH
jgi:hypothetical protein